MQDDTTKTEVDAEEEPVLPYILQRRIKALKKLQNEWAKLEVKFCEEVHKLEMKYATLAQPIFDKRRDIVKGAVEPSDGDCDWVDDDEIEEARQRIDSLTTEQVDNKNLENAIVGVPGFWLQVFRNIDALSEMIQEHDEPILRHLDDIKVSYNETPPGFTLEFHFSPNDYFTNTVLTKYYEYEEKPPANILDYEGQQIKLCRGSPINWNKGKNVTVKLVKKRQKHKGHGQTRVVTKTVQNDSFFTFFSPPTVPTTPDEELDDETLDLLDADYDIGQLIRDRIINRAVLIFTGEYIDDEDEEDDMYGEGEEGEEEDDDFEEEEEEEEDGGRSRRRANGSRGLHRRGGPGAVDKKNSTTGVADSNTRPPECQQQ